MAAPLPLRLRRVGSRAARFACLAFPALLAAAVPAPAAAAPPLPWEVWRDLTGLARLPAGDQVLLRSSFCPGGCRYDRTSDGDPRFLRTAGEEAVIFDEPGAGAVTRIWVTGPSLGEPLDSSIRVRVRLDGEAAPRLDLPLAELFRGDRAPFVAPLVADRERSSGGNVSYVPIPYRKGCRISLVGAGRARLWYQITYHRLDRPGAVATFTGGEDLGAWADLLAGAGRDPWPRLPGATPAPPARPPERRSSWRAAPAPTSSRRSACGRRPRSGRACACA